MKAKPFQDNVVILAGASQGIGEQIAYLLADQGARLILAARNAGNLERVAAVCRDRGGETLVVPVDLTDEARCKLLIERTVEHYGRIDTLLYNAGRGYPRRFVDMPDLGTIRSEINLNYLGLVACTHYALPHLQKTGGRLVGIGSLGGMVGFPGTSGYNASKHAMRGFLNTLRVELRGTGISVTALYLGAIRTARLEETMGERINRIPTMAPERCAAIIVDAAGKRRRQVVMTIPGKLVTWLYQVVPGLLDRLVLAGLVDQYGAD